MDIKYLGHSSFSLRSKRGTVVTDPFDPKMVGLRFPKVEAQIVTLSHDHRDHNQYKLVGGDPLVINLAGEYEQSGIRITGFPVYHDDKKGEARGKNTIYKIEQDGVLVLHCGDLGHKLSDTLVEEIDQVDVLLIPVGGHYTIGPKEAAEVVKLLEPKLVIPMHYKHPKLDSGFSKKLSPLSDFLSEMDVSDGGPVKTLRVKKQDLGEEMSVVVMEVV